MNQNSPYLFVLEMANNHMGDVEHGLRMIREFGNVCKKFPFQFAFKLQYRDLDSYIHPSMRGRMDVKYVKRFSETRLSRSDFDRLVSEMKASGFLPMSTPFDEPSVDIIEEQKMNFIKVASCSFTDWPLLERIVKSPLPVIASTAGARIEDIDRVVSFFLHRKHSLSILHCVGEYPTPDEHAELSQIDYLKHRYPDLRIGFSTHENPNNMDNIKIAIAKGATIFEKHVGLPTEKYAINEYSATPEQIEKWLTAAQYAILLCGTNPDRFVINEKEAASLHSLRRGVFTKRDIKKGESIRREDVFFAFPPVEGQFTANDWSKYGLFEAEQDIKAEGPLTQSNVRRNDVRDRVWDIAQRVKAVLKESKVVLPGRMEMEISHHYGLEKFDQTGITMLTVINRGYCKKLIVVLPGQNHPEQYHNKKDETFHVLYGEIDLVLNGEKKTLAPGEVLTVEPGTRHAFSSVKGAVIEELSSTHFKDDSFYTDEAINKNKDRKTLLSYWMD
ncbi:MAG: N-acetylneuraminate synthase family protein [Bacteriovoracaceae bacterium]